MKCKDCGYENKQDAKFCQGCGAKLGSETKKAYEPQREYYEPMPMPRKKNTGVIITVISLSVLLVAAIVTIVLILVLGGNKDDNKSSNNNNNEYNYNNNNNNNNNNSSNTLICTGKDAQAEGTITIKLDNNDIVKSVSATLTFSSLEDAKEYAEVLGRNGTIDFTRNGRTIIIDDYSTATNDNFIGKTKSYVINSAKRNGVTCK